MPYRRTPTKWTTESLVKRIREISPSLCLLGEYTNYSDSIKCHCSICGNTWFPNTGNLLKGCGCPECAKRNQSSRPKNNKKTRQKWTQSSVIEKVHENDPNIEVIGPYLNTSSNIECHCKQCGEVWFPTANNLIQGKSHCPKCSRSNATKRTSMTHDEFIKRVIDNNPDVEILGQ